MDSNVSLRTKIGYSAGHIFNDLCSGLWFTYLLIYFHNIERFPNTLAGVLLLIGQVADAVATPFVGHQADRTDDTACCIKYGRLKTWHLIGSFCVFVAFPFLYLGCLGCELTDYNSQVVYFAPFVIIFQFGWAAVQISHLALIPQLTADPYERTELTSIRYFSTVAANVTVYIVAWLVLGVGSKDGTDRIIGPQDEFTFKVIVIILVAIGSVFTVLFHVLVKEDNSSSGYTAIGQDDTTPLIPSAPSHLYSDSRQRMSSMDWFKQSQFYVVATVYMCTRLFCNVSQAYVPIFVQNTLRMQSQSVAYIPLTMFMSGFVVSTIIKPLNKILGGKFAYILGCTLGTGGCVMVYFGRGEMFTHYFIYVTAMLIGAGGSTILVTSLSMTADLIGNSTESGAFVYGAMSFTDKLSNGIAIMVIQYFSPFDPLCEACGEYYRYILAYVCGTAAVLGALSVLLLKNNISSQAEIESSAVTSTDSNTSLTNGYGAINNSQSNGHGLMSNGHGPISNGHGPMANEHGPMTNENGVINNSLSNGHGPVHNSSVRT